MDLLTQHQFTHCPVAIQAYPAPNYKLPIFASLELLHHTPTRPRTPPTRQQPSENEPNRRSPRLQPSPLPQATGKQYTNLKHQKNRAPPSIRSHQHHSHTVNGSGKKRLA
ncbi:hypothetical protein ACOSQ2_010283 [Xanthoceras sorbifolium]